ncbi:MAG: hypothetical protein ACRCYL_08250 [Kluyvera sp.]
MAGCDVLPDGGNCATPNIGVQTRVGLISEAPSGRTVQIAGWRRKRLIRPTGLCG